MDVSRSEWHDWTGSVLSRLDTIDERLRAIEDQFNEATSFAEGVVAEGGLFGPNGLGDVKGMLDSMFPMSGMSTEEGDTESPVDLQELIGSLKDLKGQLTAVSNTISEPSDKG